MHFYQRLAGLRKDAGLSQEQLAEKAGVSRQTIFKWEAGLASPSMENILALCRIFGVSADELIGNETPEEKTENEKAESIVQNPAPFDRLFHFEYKSKRTLWGLPLVHINVGMGFYRAKGIFAIGNLACGIVSVGCLSMGLLSFGALALGLLVLAGVGIGGLAVGGAAAGIFAVGGVAVGFVAIGGAAIGTYSLGGAAIASRIAATSGTGYARAPLGVSGRGPGGNYAVLVSDLQGLINAAKETFPSAPRWILELLAMAAL